MIKEAIAKVVAKKDLPQQEAYDVMKEIMTGKATPSQIAGLLVALVNKGETVAEISGFALAMRDSATPVAVNVGGHVDSCGTGGDGQGGLNISTAAAFVVAGVGIPVAKHGNRSISSKCGSADVLELMGVKVDPVVASVEACINRAGIGFMFAPNFHPAMRYAMPTRKELGIRTVFNILGPLTNPAKPQVQLIGVYRKELGPALAQVLAKMGHLGGLVVHSNGWDEITLDHPTQVSEMLKGRVKNYRLTHRDFGLPKVPSRHLKGGDAASNADVIMRILKGEPLPARHVVVANAAALIWISKRAFGQAKFSLKDAVRLAENSLSSGSAIGKCEQMAELSHALT